MQLNSKLVALGVIAVGGLIAGAYLLGSRQTEQPEAPVTAMEQQAEAQPQIPAESIEQQAVGEGKPIAGRLQPGAQMPSGHPPIPQMAQEQTMQPVARPADPEREGKVQHIDSDAKFTHFRVGNRNVKDIIIENSVAWIGTSGGLIRYDSAKDEYKIFDNKSGLLSNGVFHVSKINDKITLGTYGGGMAQLTDLASGKWKIYNIPEGLADGFVYDVLRVSNGDVWIATWSGANRVRGGALDDASKWDTYTIENTKGGVPNDWVYGLAEGKNGEIWLATEGGLARFKDDKWQNWNHDKGLGAAYEKVKKDLAFQTDPSKVSSHHAKQKQEMGLQGVSGAYNPNYIISMVVDRDGVVWCGTWGAGLSRFDGSKWKTYTTIEGLPGNHVFMLHLDSKGKLWVGTNNGLARMDGGKFKVYTAESDGLFSNAVFSMADDTDGSYWLGSFGGVTHIRFDSKKQ